MKRLSSKEALAVLAALVLLAGGGGLLGVHWLTAARNPIARTCKEKGDSTFGCYEGYYDALVARAGVAAAFADLKAHYTTDPRIEVLCHAITHHIGRAAFTQYSGIAEAFAHGDDFCASGYYHGVLQGFSAGAGRGSLLANLDAVCAGVPGKERHSLDYYNCVHGLGHGIMALTGDSLFEALRACDGLTGVVEQEACHNGVFMENLVVDGEHGGHYSRYLRPDEPLYPCTAVEPRYKVSCFEIQTSYALGATQGDFVKVFALCARVEPRFRATCYQSLGRDASTVSLNRVPETVAKCNLGSDREQRSNCVRGAALDFIYFYHSDVQARQLCAALEPALREDCRSTVATTYRRF
ncbi:MAG TPA: hypothetical protein VFD76_02720 [Gemmatimonadales bacterium]|nr:hypothetical protein [Gemmatimonadales bacterium]